MSSVKSPEQERVDAIINSKTVIFIAAIIAFISIYDAFFSYGLMMFVEIAKAIAAISFLVWKRFRYAAGWLVIAMLIVAFVARRIL